MVVRRPLWAASFGIGEPCRYRTVHHSAKLADSMSKVRVAIDTSILRGDGGLSSAAMNVLAAYAANGHVEILLPSIVAREYASKPSVRIEAMEELRKTTKSLKRTSPNDLHKKIADFEHCVGEAFNKHETAAKERFEEWQRRTGAVVVPISGDHAAKAMDKYFAGDLPFGSPKARTDIPDALIAEGIFELASQDPLFAVVADGRLAQALETSDDTSLFKSIRDLLESDEFEDALSQTGVRTEREKENAEKAAMEFLADNVHYLKSLEDNVSHLVSGKTLHYRNRWYDEKDSPDEIYIASVQEVSDWRFDGHDYLGEGVAVVDFKASVEIEADDPGSEWRDEDGNLDSSRTVTVSGAVSISLDLVDLSRDPAKVSGAELLKGASISIDELDDISLVDRSH